MCSKVNNLIFFYERQTRDIKFYTKDFVMIERFKAPIKSDFCITDIAYSETLLAFGCTGTDNHMHFWNFNDKKLKFLKSIKTDII